jgi:hypothetical protein
MNQNYFLILNKNISKKMNNIMDDFPLEYRLAMLVGSILSPSAETYGDSEEGMVSILENLFGSWELSGDPREVLYDVQQYMGDFELLDGNEDWLSQNMPADLLHRVSRELQIVAENENADISDNRFIQMYNGTPDEAENKFIDSEEEEEELDEEYEEEEEENPFIDSDDGEGQEEDTAHGNGGEGCSM